MKLSKLPSECASKEDIRSQIDAIDREIITLFSQRFQYVKEIVKFKTDAAGVVAEDRRNEVIRVRGEWAQELGLDKEAFEQVYAILIEYFIKEEMKLLK
ncbi:MAG: chorismate mutase [Bacteroidota bacterium]|nr:chorismate mutase [Bacteroidota bacterium]